MKSILVIGEKPSQIKKFKEAILRNSQSKQEDSRIYSYEGIWEGKLASYRMKLIPLAGHISHIDTPPAFGWGKVEPIEIVKDPKALIFKDDYKFKKILRDNAAFDELYIATDPDSEGDNIGFEAYNILIKKNPKLKTSVKRVWNASLTDSEIKRAFLETESSNQTWDTKLALSVQGRQIADAWLGFAGTREITQSARSVHRIKVFSVGRVQLPTLKMIVDRDLEHEAFVSSPLFNLQVELSKTNNDKFIALHNKNPFTKEDDINSVLNKIKTEKQSKVKNIENKRINRRPPAPLNTTGALSLISRLFKLKAEKSLSILSDLYLEGLLSYPRTENARFTDKFPHKDILQKLNTEPNYNQLITKIKSDTQVKTNGRKKGVEDHDPIHPTGELPKITGKITKLHLDVLERLSLYYIGMFMDDLIVDKVKVDIDIKNELFIAEGKVVVNEGWTEAIYWQKSKDEILPILHINEQLNIQKFNKIKSQTKPKPRFSDAIILRQMERLGLGTKSSRPSILAKLEERGYVARQKTQIISQITGRTLIQVLDPIWPDIVTNTFTKDVEAKMDDVARGVTTYKIMLEQLRQQYIKQHLLLLDNLPKFTTALKQIDPSLLGQVDSKSYSKGKKIYAKPVGKKCPLCKKGNVLERKNKSKGNLFLGCSNYPTCKWIQSVNDKKDKINRTVIKENLKPKTINVNNKLNENDNCPRCKTGKLIIKVNEAKNIKYFACLTYPTCKYTNLITK